MDSARNGPAAGHSGQGHECFANVYGVTVAPQPSAIQQRTICGLMLEEPLPVRMGDMPLEAWLEGVTPAQWRARYFPARTYWQDNAGRWHVAFGLWHPHDSLRMLKTRLLEGWPIAGPVGRLP